MKDVSVSVGFGVKNEVLAVVIQINEFVIHVTPSLADELAKNLQSASLFVQENQ